MDTSKLMYRDGLMKDERILVTGGGTGLGKEMAEGFLKLGAEVHICGRSGGVCEETAKELMDKHGGKVVPHACDIRVAEAITDMNDGIWAKHGPLTGLVNNAAGNFISRTEDLSIRGFDAIANIVFRGTFYMTHDIGTRWIKGGTRGNVISILTTWVWNGGPFVVPSAMSKAAVNTMTQSLAVEWARYGLRFNAIAPGPFPTKGAWERLLPGDLAEKFDLSKKVPLRRVGDHQELANLAAYLVSDFSAYVNGEVMTIDGGEWLEGAGQFNLLQDIPEELWDQLEAMVKAKRSK